MSTEFIEFQDRSKLNETVVQLLDEDDVLSIDVIENGRTLRVVRKSNAKTEAPEGGEIRDETAPEDEEDSKPQGEDAPEPSGEAEGDSADPGTGEEPKDGEDAPEDGEDLLGEVDSAPKDEKPEITPEITPETDRNTLREIVKKYDLDVEVPTAGPLQPLRDRVEAALAEKE